MSPAAWAAALLAVDPAGLGGLTLRTAPGPARDAYLAGLRALWPTGAAWRRLPHAIGDERLLGGLDLAATLQAGRPVAVRGVLAEADGGVVVLPMAERVSIDTAARLAGVMDRGAVSLQRDGLAQDISVRFGLVLLDEGLAEDERPPTALLDRLAFAVELAARDDQSIATTRGAVLEAAARLRTVTVPEELLQALAETAAALGVESCRVLLLAFRATRAAAALAGRLVASHEDAVLAGRLVLAPRATSVPPQEDTDEATEEAPEPDTPEQGEPDRSAEAPPQSGDDMQTTPADLGEIMLEATQAAIPAGLLAQIQAAGSVRAGAVGRAGAVTASLRRGRPIGVRRGAPASGARLNVVETLRAAAPWQRLRRQEIGGLPRIHIRRDDFRVTRFEQRTESTAIFVVDASGSAALNRLAEAKGAVELLLADCYVRRDHVALLAFRGATATLLLPPTTSLVRAKRGLAGMVGGGGTPLAAALDQAMLLATAVQRRGQTPFVVLLTDGRANVARDGQPGRARAGEEARQAARNFRAGGFAALLIDTAPNPQKLAASLAAEMGGRYLALPYANSEMLSRAVRAAEPPRR